MCSSDLNVPNAKEVSLEMKEFIEVRDNTKELEIKQHFTRAAALCESINLDWQREIGRASCRERV